MNEVVEAFQGVPRGLRGYPGGPRGASRRSEEALENTKRTHGRLRGPKAF